MEKKFNLHATTGLVILSALLFTVTPNDASAQENQSSDRSETTTTDGERTVVIIEETSEKDGKKIVKKTIKTRGEFGEGELKEMLREEMGEDLEFINSIDHDPDIDFHQEHAMPEVWIGIMIENADTGVRITEIMDDSPAKAAGLEIGSVITAIDGKAVENVEQMMEILGEYSPRDVLSLTLMQEGESTAYQVTLAERPARKYSHASNDKSKSHKWATEGDNNHAKAFHTEKPRFGVNIDNTEEGGVLVTRVYTKSVAEAAGLKAGDILLKFNSEEIDDVEDLQEKVKSAPADEKIKVVFLRDGKRKSVKLVFDSNV